MTRAKATWARDGLVADSDHDAASIEARLAAARGLRPWLVRVEAMLVAAGLPPPSKRSRIEDESGATKVLHLRWPLVELADDRTPTAPDCTVRGDANGVGELTVELRRRGACEWRWYKRPGLHDETAVPPSRHIGRRPNAALLAFIAAHAPLMRSTGEQIATRVRAAEAADRRARRG